MIGHLLSVDRKRQFAVVENPGFWNWTFTLKDENGNVLAEIDRHFRGFGFEVMLSSSNQGNGVGHSYLENLGQTFIMWDFCLTLHDHLRSR